jgi:3-hydroxyisobutyrate dehydrogenase-like beta-hydroxyacid dehydrogenase
MTKNRIAVLGLGIMGNGIARNFLEKGYEVTVWNRSPKKCEALIPLGAKVAATPIEACENSDLIFDVTANDETSTELFCDPDQGLFSVGRKDQVFISCVTLSLACVKNIAEQAAKSGLVFFDMPMTGSRKGAETGTLTLFVGGDESRFINIERDLKAIASDIRYFGPSGSGMKIKLVLNAIQATHVFVFGESMKRALSIGLNEQKTGEYLIEKPGGPITSLAWDFYQNPPEQTQFSVKWMLKDLKYAKESFNDFEKSCGLSANYLDVSIAILQKAFDAGLGDQDWTMANKI